MKKAGPSKREQGKSVTQPRPFTEVVAPTVHPRDKILSTLFEKTVTRTPVNSPHIVAQDNAENVPPSLSLNSSAAE